MTSDFANMSLDEIMECIRSGEDPKDLAMKMGVNERTIRYRASVAGRSAEYIDVKKKNMSDRTSSVDVSSLMALADKGMTLDSACVELGHPKKIVTLRLENDGRLAEFYIRSQESRQGNPIPVISSEEYHEGPREILISVIPKLPESMRDSMKEAIQAVDRMISDGSRLSRLCGGDRP